MEQLGNIFSHVIKFRFWYIAGVSCVALLVNWYMINTALGVACKEGTSKIEANIRDIDSVLAYTTAVNETADRLKAHPNEGTQQGMEAETAKAVAALIEAWKLRRQAQEDVLKWPLEIIGSDKFVAKFRQYDPPEKFPDIKPNSEIDGYCLLYFQQIQKRMDGICDLIRTQWDFVSGSESEAAAAAASAAPAAPTPMQGAADQGVGGGQDEGRPGGQESGLPPSAGSGTSGAAETGGAAATQGPALQLSKPLTVVWNRNNQTLWFSKLRDFRGRDGSRTEFPTGYQVLALQQDLWLLEAMFKVIADVNGETLANDLAKIEQIHHVVFGREARAQLGKVMVPDARLGSGFAGVSLEASAGPPGGGTGVPFSFDIPAELALLSPFHGKYVDANFQPVEVSRIHSAMVSPTPAPADLELIVAKRVPFRIAMKMSEQAIPEFIAACGNSPFEFEIAQVRINPQNSSSEAAVLNGGSSSQDPSANASSPFRGQSGEAELNATRRVGAKSVESRVNDDVDVEFYGIVRLYNPVDEAQIRAVAGIAAPVAN